MDQVISALNELHQRANSAINAVQGGFHAASCTDQPQQQQLLKCSSLSAVASSRNSSSAGRRVHFTPPFAALSPLGRVGGGGSAAGKKQKKQQDEEDERILISEVRTSDRYQQKHRLLGSHTDRH
jgi:hypothetical protein